MNLSPLPPSILALAFGLFLWYLEIKYDGMGLAGLTGSLLILLSIALFILWVIT